MSEPIAIVGLGGVLPGATQLDDFWRVVEGGVDTASEPPPGRWTLDLDQAYAEARAVPDRVYSRRACFVRDFELDPSGLNLPPELLDTLDPMVHLALHAGRQAWLDAATEPVDPARVGVMLGNIVLPTSSASAMADWILGRRFERDLFRAAGTPMPPEDRAPVAAINRWVAGLPAAMLARALGLGGDRLPWHSWKRTPLPISCDRAATGNWPSEPTEVARTGKCSVLRVAGKSVEARGLHSCESHSVR